MNPIRTFLLLCTLAGLSGYSLASHAVCFTQACVQARAAATPSTATAATVTPAAPTQPAAAPTSVLQMSKADLIKWFTSGQALACAQPDGTKVKIMDCPCTTAILNDLTATVGSTVPIEGPVAVFIEGRIVVGKLQSGLDPVITQACGGVIADTLATNVRSFAGLYALFGLP